MGMSCTVKVHFAITSLPPVTLLMKLSALRVPFQVEGAVTVDSVLMFLSMHPRPPRIYWPVTATNECVKTGLLMPQSPPRPGGRCIDFSDHHVPVPRGSSVLVHTQYCCSPHIDLAAHIFSRLYPSPL